MPRIKAPDSITLPYPAKTIYEVLRDFASYGECPASTRFVHERLRDEAIPDYRVE